MFKKILLGIMLGMPLCNAYAQIIRQESFITSDICFDGAWYIQKIPLGNAETPKIQVVAAHYEPAGTTPPADAGTAALQVRMGTERKQSYALVSVPAYRKTEDGTYERLRSFTLSVTEKDPVVLPQANTLKVTAAASVLAEGNWHKLALTKKGIYKLDYGFLKKYLGTGVINSADIRLFGNGGAMLQENNNKPRYDDLQENAIELHDGGDGRFNEGDYFLFYASGPLDWVKDSSRQLFHHRTNLYSDSSYYFLTLDKGPGMRINTAPDAGSATVHVDSYNDYALHELEERNLGHFGKTWWGEVFGFTDKQDATRTFSFPVSNSSDSVYFEYNMASAAVSAVPLSHAAVIRATLNGNLIGVHDEIGSVGGGADDSPGFPVYNSGLAVINPGGSLNFTFTYTKNTSDAKAYLDYIEVNFRRKLLMNGTQWCFRDFRSIGPAAVARYTIGEANAAMRVWDITDPLHPQTINGTLSGSNYTFNREATRLREFIAFSGDYLSPVYAGKVANQNLHGMGQTDYVIVTHEDFMNAAEKLADFHRQKSGLRVAVVPAGLVYNEFGSGTRDISAIRDFMKMFYERAGADERQMPKHLLLLGQATYDYKNIVSKKGRIVPTYQSPQSLDSYSGHCSDDFFAILDPTEFIDTGIALMDIGVGRLPATSVEDADNMVAKILRYKSPQAFGPWRLNNVYAGDVEDDAGTHLADADYMSETIAAMNNTYNSVKVYLDNMNLVNTPGSTRCPDANKAISDNIYKGTFLFNYNGHGNPSSLSSKRILTADDFKNWKNRDKLPIMLTATCSFGRFDNPAAQSSGEKLMTKGDGGAIALVTTTQVVFADQNREFISAYLKTQFSGEHGNRHSLGEAYRLAKNSVIGVTGINTRKFALVGDPALVPDFPRYQVATDSIRESTDTGLSGTDSLKSLGTYTVSGSVRDDAGYVMEQFNGKVNVIIYDKRQDVTINTFRARPPAFRRFTLQNNLVYKGIATVTRGQFHCTFIMPKDINYDFGKGKIVYYATDSVTDASGLDTAITVGGFSDYAPTDNDAPVVRPFLHDSLFRDGGITNPSTLLYAIITDESGINISGNSVGHDLTAILDDEVTTPYTLNDFYETEANTYKRGYVNFPVNGLAAGKHTFRVKAWDVFNNSGEGTVRFEVLEGGVVVLERLSCYPNPFRDITRFVFEHNHPDESLKATLHIFNTTGSLVRSIDQDFTPALIKSSELTWDGTDNGGAKLPAGMYFCRLRIATTAGMEDLGVQKVILLR